MYSPTWSNWFAKKNFSKHKTSAAHNESVKRQEEDERQERLNARARGDDEPLLQLADLLPPVPEVILPPEDATMLEGEQEMWDCLDGGDYMIELEDPEDIRRQRAKEFECRVREFNLWSGMEDNLPDFANIDMLEAAQAEEREEQAIFDILEGVEWYPYPSKLMFLLDAMDNMPRLRISSTLMSVMLWVLQEAGVKDVPSALQLRRVQKSLRKGTCVETVHWTSPKGNMFSFNNPASIIANDWANPKIRPYIRRYPSLPTENISEIWHAEKWRRTIDRHALSPMYDNGTRHFYIDEPAQTAGGQIVIPIRWLEDDYGKVWCDTWKVEYNNDGTATVLDGDDGAVLLDATELRDNMLDLLKTNEIPDWSELTVNAGHPDRMPNPDRKLAEGEPLYTSFIDVFGDDVSGNRSKSWNKHWNVYIKHCNLPRKMLNHEWHTHFVSTSQHAPVPEQFHGIKSVIEETHAKPIRVFDPLTKQYTRFKLQCNCGPGDNPSQSETLGHIGGNGNFPCRKCHVGGTVKEKSADAGYHSLFAPGLPRNMESTLETVRSQVKEACTGIADRVIKSQKTTGVKDSYTQYWVEKIIDWSRERQNQEDGRPVKVIREELEAFAQTHADAVYSPFLTLRYCDMTQDTPIEILHTVLLGVVKYAWHGTHTTWKGGEKGLYIPRLQSTDTQGLAIPSIRAGYIMQYANSLIGRQLKILAQVNTFHIHDLVSEDQFRLVKSVGVLASLLWVPEIHDMSEYLIDVNVAVANVLDLAVVIDSSKIIKKIKFHLLTHITDDIKRFGPIVGVATEGYESYNGIFRLCSVLSNHLAPSRDIAYQLGKQETFKHLISGGWWMEGDDLDSSWRQSGFTLQKYVEQSKMLNHLFQLPSEAKWLLCKSVIGAFKDECRVGSWVFAKSAEGAPNQNHTFTGRILEILTTESEGTHTLIVIERYQIAQTLHPKYDMPVLVKPFGESANMVVSPKDLLFDYNVQHDCFTANCKDSGTKAMLQERIDSGRTEKVIEHQPSDRYVINTHAFHNVHRLRSIGALRALIRPRLLFPEREAHHKAAAAKLRISGQE
ncbi:hypothetical protein FA15DRAFT_677776 [Coprinopsis marcescibilis]|uniref:Uncharacterized protein n=1 Tax=Coprinopsis marcescibilis TaxID=230819 RepID=A0A5C3LC72_COPMA|nr:hypothetical protein FA15DRAFT_677776 [Coprinopsis marcescibilis]